jgi:hypothetical protein
MGSDGACVVVAEKVAGAIRLDGISYQGMWISSVLCETQPDGANPLNGSDVWLSTRGCKSQAWGVVQVGRARGGQAVVVKMACLKACGRSWRADPSNETARCYDFCAAWRACGSRDAATESGCAGVWTAVKCRDDGDGGGGRAVGSGRAGLRWVPALWTGDTCRRPWNRHGCGDAPSPSPYSRSARGNGPSRALLSAGCRNRACLVCGRPSLRVAPVTLSWSRPSPAGAACRDL